MQKDKFGNNILTVEELVDLLQKIPNKKALVSTEGCDCWGSANGVQVIDNDSILITRSD